MPSSSFAPKYWEKKSIPPPTNPQYPLNIREENCAQRPTAPTSICPREAIIIVSIIEAVVVRRFCIATGTAITATFFMKEGQSKRAAVRIIEQVGGSGAGASFLSPENVSARAALSLSYPENRPLSR